MEGSARGNAGNCRRGRANLPSACEEGGQKAAHAGERTVDTAENRAQPGSIADSGEASADSGEVSIERVDAARRDVSVGREDAAWRDAARAGTSLAPSNVQAGIGAGQGELGLRPEPSAGEGSRRFARGGIGIRGADAEDGFQRAVGRRPSRKAAARACGRCAGARGTHFGEPRAGALLVKRFAGRGADMEDLFQYGCMGLIKAIDRFDPSFSVRFSTYAVPVILGEIRRPCATTGRFTSRAPFTRTPAAWRGSAMNGAPGAARRPTSDAWPRRSRCRAKTSCSR